MCRRSGDRRSAIKVSPSDLLITFPFSRLPATETRGARPISSARGAVRKKAQLPALVLWRARGVTRVPGPPIGVTRLGSPASPRIVPVDAAACRAYRDPGTRYRDQSLSPKYRHTGPGRPTHTHHTCIQASSQAIRREQSIPQIGQGSTHVAHHVMLKQQSFKRGGRGRSQMVETGQGSKINRREGEGRERRAGLGNGSAG